MKVDVSLHITPTIGINLKELGGVPFEEIKVGDLLYSNSQLGKVYKKTPKRVYVEIVQVLPYDLRTSIQLPGARAFSGNEDVNNRGLYVENTGNRWYVTLPDEMTFLEMVEEHKAWSTHIAKLRAEMVDLYTQRAIEQCKMIGAAKGIDMIFDQEKISS